MLVRTFHSALHARIFMLLRHVVTPDTVSIESQSETPFGYAVLPRPVAD
jgi:hypothetical protein